MEFVIGDTREKENTYKIIRSSQLLDILLEPWKETLGQDYDAYKNHALRTINYCYFILPNNEEVLQHVIITAAYHQLGLWIKNNKDYSSTSAETLIDNSEKIGFNPVPKHIIQAIIKHSSLTKEFGKNDLFAYTFWRAFRIEMSMGYSEQGLPSDFIDQVRTCIPTKHYNKIVTEKLLLSLAKRFKIM